jgi:BlaI family penicillinase repressor
MGREDASNILGPRCEVFFGSQFVFLTASEPYVTYCNATMTNTQNTRLRNMGEVEQLVMDYIWTHGPCSSEACREGLAAFRPMKDSTIRTVLRRLEEKGFLTHQTEGRTFIYKASDARQNVALRAVKAIIDRFCGGSAEQLVLGMVDNAVLNRKQLERLARKIAEKTITEKKISDK